MERLWQVFFWQIDTDAKQGIVQTDEQIGLPSKHGLVEVG